MKKLLFVEPSEPARADLVSVLKPEENNWSIHFAGSVEEALALHQSEPFDIVVSAYLLPDGSGLELFKWLRNESPGTIRFLVIDEVEKHMLRAMVGDAQQILTKPIAQEEFVEQVDRALSLRSIVNDPALLKLLGKGEALPPLPRVFEVVSRKLRDPSASLSEVAGHISEDIVLSSKVLKLVNSALFSLSEPVQNVECAVSLLGSGMVGSLVFSQGLEDTFKCGPGSEHFLEELNRHGIECASMTSKILTLWGARRDVIEKAFFCGIAHDVGKLVLSKFAPVQWKQIGAIIDETGCLDVDAERKVAGISHSEIAAYFLAVWGFSNEQVIAIALHHEPSRLKERQKGLACALHLAECICETERHGTFDWDYLKECEVGQDELDRIQKLKGT
ncbi:response regulator [Pontiellaceae bacterium B1224]|nr:response regulator [Pontiellaceae bacterium B1224]